MNCMFKTDFCLSIMTTMGVHGISRIHDEYLWLDRPYIITKEVIEQVTGLWYVGTFFGNEVSKELCYSGPNWSYPTWVSHVS